MNEQNSQDVCKDMTQLGSELGHGLLSTLATGPSAVAQSVERPSKGPGLAKCPTSQSSKKCGVLNIFSDSAGKIFNDRYLNPGKTT